MIAPALVARTELVADLGKLVSRASPTNPLAFLRDGDGIVGIGETLRLEFTGSTRIADAAAAWRQVAGSALITDPLSLPGTGLVAFGSFAFAEGSAAPSVLVVPSVIFGRRTGVCWVTRVSAGPASGSASASALPTRAPLGNPFSVSFEPGSMTSMEYLTAVSDALDRGIDKVVLARDLIATLPAGADLRVPLGRLAAAYPDTFTFAVDGLLGASPETLVQSIGGRVTARVLAGSSARGADGTADQLAQASLVASNKDLAEHDFALQSVLAALAPHTSSLTASAVFALELPNLWHLASDIAGALADGSSALDLVAALHPTAAVAGSPTDAATALIAELEPFDRGRYAGPIGWIDSRGDGEWAVALRCALVAGNTVTAYAGAGIVSGSEPARELAETELKFRPVVEAFA